MEYSSKYGGSIKLIFFIKSDTGIEVQRGQYLWDLKFLELHFFITPTKEGLRDLKKLSGHTVCEVIWEDQICMALPQPGGILEIIEDNHLPELKQATTTLGKSIVQSVHYDLNVFTGVFLWSLFPDLLGSSKVVESIELSNHFIDLNTRQGIPMIIMKFRVRDAHLAVYPKKFKLSLRSEYSYLNGRYQRPDSTFEIIEGANKTTPWVTAGIWRSDEMYRVHDIAVSFEGLLVNDFTCDEVFHRYYVYPCWEINEVNNANANDTIGLIQNMQVELVYVLSLDHDWSYQFQVDVIIFREKR